MKIRTKEDLVDALNNDLGWRKNELTALFYNVQKANPKTLPTALRAATVLLYAHWEGYIKNAAENYLEYIYYKKLPLNQVSNNLLALALKHKLNAFSSNKNPVYHIQFIDYIQNNLTEQVQFNIKEAVNTRSNLNSEVLNDIFTTIGIDTKPYELKYNLIDSQLLNYRNTIAHGNYLTIDIKEYQNLHIEIINMLNRVNTDISNCAVLEKYKKVA